MTASDMLWQCDEDLDSEFQMLYRDEDFRIVPCFIADFTQLKFLSWCCFSFFFSLTFHWICLQRTWLSPALLGGVFYLFHYAEVASSWWKPLTVFLMQVKLAKSHSVSYLAYGIQVQDENAKRFFFISVSDTSNSIFLVW